jgi:peroxiredoxin
MSLEVGQVAPDFTLQDHFGQDVSLSDFRGKKNVVLIFFPMSFTGICTGELCEIRDNSSEFVSEDVQVIGISCDATPSQKAFADQEGFDYPLLSDFWPHGEVAKTYGAFFAERGFAMRGTFVIDKEGILRWSVVNGPGDARKTDDYKAALAQLA